MVQEQSTEDLPPRSYYIVDTFLYASNALRHMYAISCRWGDYLRDKARDKTLLELSKLRPDARPQNYEHIVQKLANGWDYSGFKEEPDS